MLILIAYDNIIIDKVNSSFERRKRMRKVNNERGAVKVRWSNSLGCAHIVGFTYKKHHYVWNDMDCVFYDETEGDESYMMEVPSGAVLDCYGLL